MTDADSGKKQEPNLGSLNEDAAHPFDQTNGIVDGLEGNSGGFDENTSIDEDADDVDDTDGPEFTVPGPRSAFGKDNG